MYCEVYLLDAPYHIDRPFDYSADFPLSKGDFVRVPFGRANKLRLGVVVATKEESAGEAVKPVHMRLDESLSLSEEMLRLCLFLKESLPSTTLIPTTGPVFSVTM